MKKHCELNQSQKTPIKSPSTRVNLGKPAVKKIDKPVSIGKPRLEKRTSDSLDSNSRHIFINHLHHNTHPVSEKILKILENELNSASCEDSISI